MVIALRLSQHGLTAEGTGILMTNPGKAQRLAPWQGMLLYLVIGVSWVSVGDALLARAVSDPALLTTIQTWKGWAFVLLTSVLAWAAAPCRAIREAALRVGV